MGLDMYLEKKMYIRRYPLPSEKKAPRDNLKITGLGKINAKKVCSLVFEVHSWRKANAIHWWFVKNVQEGIDDCKSYYVPEEKIKELLVICKNIINEPELANDLLPTQEGFFFGSQEYDEWYFKDLKETLVILEEEVKEIEKGKMIYDYYYQSSW